jgi:hypothetical protein
VQMVAIESAWASTLTMTVRVLFSGWRRAGAATLPGVNSPTRAERHQHRPADDGFPLSGLYPNRRRDQRPTQPGNPARGPKFFAETAQSGVH